MILMKKKSLWDLKQRMNKNPRFVVKAVGSFKQKPGCPEYSFNALGSEEVELRLCRNECYNPSDVRNKITRIEISKNHTSNL